MEWEQNRLIFLQYLDGFVLFEAVVKVLGEITMPADEGGPPDVDNQVAWKGRCWSVWISIALISWKFFIYFLILFLIKKNFF